jgi:hypothetical protein
MKDGDLCIRGKVSELTGQTEDAVVDDLVAELFGDKKTNTLILCESCIEPGEGFEIEVYHETAP